MNGIQRKKVGSNEKPFPGCLGRMVNLFDLSTGVSRNKLLTDAPHREGSTLPRNQANVAGMFNHSTNQTEDNLRASKKRANGTPVKMLIDQDMSEMECTKNPPNVVAKLMGLETLPQKLPGSSVQRNNVISYPKGRSAKHGMPKECRERSDFLEEGMKCQVSEYSEQKEYKDVYEIWQRSPQTNDIREKLPKKVVESEILDDRKMALVRQKFVEAKCLATDEKLRQSKEFQDAVEILSSNKDLLVKFLQEPNSLFTQHLNELPSIPPSPERKRITVLRPSKVSRDERFTEFEKKGCRQSRLPVQRGQSAILDKSDPRLSPTPGINRTNEYAIAVQPTRIVVLKPSPGRNHDNKPIVSSPGSLPFDEGFEDDDVKESRKFARNITQKMCDNLLGRRRDETLLSSVFSNGYTGDESSFEKSENDYAVENLSDLEVMSSSSRHSWEYVNRYSSPYSSSSFSRMSCSPESSVCREAKKRLSERWAMMTSHGNYQERRRVRRNSSTLGEMLALSDGKKSTVTDNEVNEHETTSELEPCFNSDENIECLDDSPTMLARSKSGPGSSPLFGMLNLEASDLETIKTDDSKSLAKQKGVKSSLNEEVSSSFFTRNKKTNKEKCSGYQPKDEPKSCSAETLSSLAFVHHSRGLSNAASHSNDGEGCSSSTSFLHLTNVVARGGEVHREEGLSVKRPFMTGNVGENQEQPSPISVLETPFFEDDNTHIEFSSYLKPRNQEFCMPFKNNLIDKSPPIESIARSVYWDGSSSDSSARALKSSPVSTFLEEEQNWHCLVEALLTLSGLSSEVQQCGLLFTRWHSLVNPLDPSLRDKYANLSSQELMLEAKRRQLRSSRKLVFDCVNAALMDITCEELDHRRAKLSSRAHDSSFAEGTSLTLLDCVMVKLKDWVCGEFRCVTGDIGDCDGLVVERAVRKEVGGRHWDEQLRMEMDNLGKQVERRLLEELLEEAVVELTGKV
ncbi:uncharacterized protein LOC111811436 isoform X2 [Cucurbita pepo subsp. pepo]|uniref:uncharacterized protein LOC111811436 isoform X2 n=1 Tax=Cucurbita pepo subsp. pepo TaxID=3664 RepID=UPI000C9D3EA8|nr:uncharacterized protein LOC111811436 isoform X2 [Cucurbita pepo subsp. pepo]